MKQPPLLCVGGPLHAQLQAPYGHSLEYFDGYERITYLPYAFGGEDRNGRFWIDVLCTNQPPAKDVHNAMRECIKRLTEEFQIDDPGVLADYLEERLDPRCEVLRMLVRFTDLYVARY